MSDRRFRRQRLSRWADEATLARLEEEFSGLSAEEQERRNAYIDARPDADVRELLGEATDADRSAARKARVKPKTRRRADPPADPPAEAAADGAEDAQDAPDGVAGAEG